MRSNGHNPRKKPLTKGPKNFFTFELFPEAAKLWRNQKEQLKREGKKRNLSELASDAIIKGIGPPA